MCAAVLMEFHLFRTRWREFQVPAMMEILELVCVRGWCLRWCQRCDKQLCSLSSFPPLLLHQRFSSNSICPSHLPEGWSAERGGPRWSWRCFPEDFVVKGSKGPRAEMEVQETLTLVILTGLKSPGRRRSMRRLIPVFCFIHPPPLTLFILLLTRSFTRTLDSSAKCEGVCVCVSKGFLHPLPSAHLAAHTHTRFTLRVIPRFGLRTSSLQGRF